MPDSLLPLPDDRRVLDAEEANEPEPWVVSRCVVHPMGYGCEASLPSCRREFIRLEPPVAGYFDGGKP